MLLRCAALAVWLASAGAAAASEPATHKPLAIGNVVQESSPAGFVYHEAPGAFGVPPESRRLTHHHAAAATGKPLPKKRLAGG